MIKLIYFWVFFLASVILDANACIKTLHMNPCIGMIRADVSYLSFEYEPIGILVLCSGYNSNAKFLLKDESWINFSKEKKLILVGLSFASNVEDLKNGSGYYYASKGSGDILLNALEKINKDKLPIYIYGFSGGAHFTSRFVEWAPDRIASWCAYSAGWWDFVSPKDGNLPIGIVACGDKDERFYASISYFKNGRKNGRQWTWITLKNVNHSPSRKLDDFVRMYFEVVINNDFDSCFVNNYTFITKKEDNSDKDCNYSYFPNVKLISKWRDLFDAK